MLLCAPGPGGPCHRPPCRLPAQLPPTRRRKKSSCLRSRPATPCTRHANTPRVLHTQALSRPCARPARALRIACVCVSVCLAGLSLCLVPSWLRCACAGCVPRCARVSFLPIIMFSVLSCEYMLSTSFTPDREGAVFIAPTKGLVCRGMLAPQSVGGSMALHAAKHARLVSFEPPTTLEEHHWQKHRPTWALSANLLGFGGGGDCSKAEELVGVTGARVLPDLLNFSECEALLELSERLGYLEPSPSDHSTLGRSGAVRSSAGCVRLRNRYPCTRRSRAPRAPCTPPACLNTGGHRAARSGSRAGVPPRALVPSRERQPRGEHQPAPSLLPVRASRGCTCRSMG